MIPDIVRSHPALQELLSNKDHIDVKSFESEQDMRTFIAGLFSYMPGWLKSLYGVRGVFVRFLGMKQEATFEARDLHPSEISMVPGETGGFFEVFQAKEDDYYVAGAKESHLDAYLIVVMESGNDGKNRFYLATVVKYNNRIGPLYFNIIRPFHHLVVEAMGRGAVRYNPPVGAIA